MPLQHGRFSIALLNMFPLQLSRIFDYQQPDADVYRTERLRVADKTMPLAATSGETLEERRTGEDRRNIERRLKQQATFLNTRKTQGRRRSHGRRASDVENHMQYRPIYFKG
ncbi:hypothetical protein [Undibacterium danionis]|uniref:Uncharacterized protein n=1 Tax=Undibacterium danionis TaxID=1812100 RepID=A0ABV6IAE8_9BURK